MMRWTVRALAQTAVIATTIVLSAPLLAQPADKTPQQQGPRPSANRQAVAAGHAGLQLFQAGDYARAFERFAEAEALFHSPVFQLYMARSRRNENRLIDARQIYNQVANAPLPSDRPPPWVQAQRDARLELSELAAIVPRLSIELIGDRDATQLELRIDGRALSIERSRQPIELDPGPHQLELRTNGGTVQRTLQLVRGVRRSVKLVLPGAPHSARTHDPVVGTSARTGPLWPGALALSLGGASLLAGAVTGALALTSAAEVTDRCVGDQCLPDDEDKAKTARALATASTATLIAGGALATLGVVLVVVRPGAEQDEEPSSALAPRATVVLSATSASLRLSF